MSNTTNSESEDMRSSDALGYDDEWSACAAFAEALNSGETEDFFSSLAPDVEFVSKWKSLYEAVAITNYLENYFFTETERKRTAFVGTIAPDGRRIPCAYSLDSIAKPRLVMTFRLAADGRIERIFAYPSHYLRHRDGKLFDVLG